jgi:hypothetical protein
VFEGEGRHFEELPAAPGAKWMWPVEREATAGALKQAAVGTTKEEVSTELSAQSKKMTPEKDAPVGRGKRDLGALLQKMEEAERLYGLVLKLLESCRMDRRGKGGKGPPADGEPLPTVESSGSPESAIIKAERKEVEGQETTTSDTRSRPCGLDAHLPRCKGPPLEERPALPNIESLRRSLDYALMRSTKSFKGPLEHRYNTMAESLWIGRLTVLKLRGCAEAYEVDDPEVSWITELL